MDDHWNWVRGLITEAENTTPAGPARIAPAPVHVPRPVDASRGTTGQFVTDTNVISMRPLGDGMASITLRQSTGW